MKMHRGQEEVAESRWKKAREEEPNPCTSEHQPDSLRHQDHSNGFSKHCGAKVEELFAGYGGRALEKASNMPQLGHVEVEGCGAEGVESYQQENLPRAIEEVTCTQSFRAT